MSPDFYFPLKRDQTSLSFDPSSSINGEPSPLGGSTGPGWKAAFYDFYRAFLFSKQNESSCIRDQYCLLADDGSPFWQVVPFPTSCILPKNSRLLRKRRHELDMNPWPLVCHRATHWSTRTLVLPEGKYATSIKMGASGWLTAFDRSRLGSDPGKVLVLLVQIKSICWAFGLSRFSAHDSTMTILPQSKFLSKDF